MTAAQVWHGLLVCGGIIGALAILFSGTVLVILVADYLSGDYGSWEWPDFDADDTIPYLPTGEQQ